jgi:hypothetical protein
MNLAVISVIALAIAVLVQLPCTPPPLNVVRVLAIAMAWMCRRSTSAVIPTSTP